MKRRGAVFLSYAREDATAVRRIAEALRVAGLEVWFDEDELRGGDAWDAKIRTQIKECTLFVPVISAHTQVRLEGYFRREWKQAAARLDDMDEHLPFLVPIVIDDTPERGARVPEAFRQLQWTRLPHGEATPDFCERIKSLLAGDPGPRPPSAATTPARPGAAAVPAKHRNWWLPAIVAAVVIAAVVLTWSLREKTPALAPVETKSTPPPITSESRQLLAQAWTLLRKQEFARGELDAAEALCKKAAALDPTDGDVWATWAYVDTWQIFFRFDETPARRTAADEHAGRAIRLAPRSFDARFAQAFYWVRGAFDSTKRTEAERILRELLAEQPEEPRALFALGCLLAPRQADREEGYALFEQLARNPNYTALALNELAWHVWPGGDFAKAEAVIDRSIAAQAYWHNLTLKALLAAFWHGDLEAAKAAMERVPVSARHDDWGAAFAANIHKLRRDAKAYVAAIEPLPREWLASHAFEGPKAFLLAQARQLAGQTEVAQREYRRALTLIEQRLTSAPTDHNLNGLKSYALYMLNERAEAEKTYALLKQLGPARRRSYGGQGQYDLVVLFEPPEVVLDLMESRFGARISQGALKLTAAALRHDPVFDPLRDHPRFQALLARAEADPQKNPHARVKAASDSAPPPATKAIAVLAFENLSGDKANEYFSDGISEELLHVLGRVPGLVVRGRTSAFSFKGKNVASADIGRQLDVTHLVTGSVRKFGDRVRITAQLTRAATDEVLWSSGSLDREVKDILALQDEIAGVIAKQLSLTLGGRPRAAAPVNVEAYEEILQGRFHAEKYTESALKLAISHYQKALSKQPNYAEAYAGLATTYSLVRYFAYVPPDSITPQFREAVSKALALDDSVSAVHVAQASLLAYVDRNYGAADRAFQRALALDPANASARAYYALFLAAMSRFSEAQTIVRQAQQLDPLSVNAVVALGWVRHFAGDSAGAIEAGRQALTMAPSSFNAHEVVAQALFRQGNRDAALAQLELAGQAESPPQTLGMLGMFYARAGRKGDARRILAELQAKARVGYVPAYTFSRLHDALGEHQQAHTWMNKAIDDREGRALFLRASSSNDPDIKTNPHFAEWMKRLGFDP